MEGGEKRGWGEKVNVYPVEVLDILDDIYLGCGKIMLVLLPEC